MINRGGVFGWVGEGGKKGMDEVMWLIATDALL